MVSLAEPSDQAPPGLLERDGDSAPDDRAIAEGCRLDARRRRHEPSDGRADVGEQGVVARADACADTSLHE